MAVVGLRYGTPLTCHTSPVRAVALGRIASRDVIISGSDDHTVRVWDPVTATQLFIQNTFGSVYALAQSDELLVFAADTAICAAFPLM